MITKRDIINMCLSFEGAIEDYPFDLLDSLLTYGMFWWLLRKQKINLLKDESAGEVNLEIDL